MYIIMSALMLSTEQQAALDKVQPPPGWSDGNPPLNPFPYDYNNSYTAPAWISGQKGNGIKDAINNQFTSSLTQKKGPSQIYSYLADGRQSGNGIFTPFMAPVNGPEMFTKPMDALSKRWRQKPIKRGLQEPILK